MKKVKYHQLISVLKDLKFKEIPLGSQHSIFRHIKGAQIVLKHLRKTDYVPIQVLANARRTVLVHGIASNVKFNELVDNIIAYS